MLSDLGIEHEISCTAVAYAATAPTRQSKVASKTLLFSDKTTICTWPSNLYAPKYALYCKTKQNRTKDPDDEPERELAGEERQHPGSCVERGADVQRLQLGVQLGLVVADEPRQLV